MLKALAFMLAEHARSLRRGLFWALCLVFVAGAWGQAAAVTVVSDPSRKQWEEAVRAAKGEGQVVTYGSADFQFVLAEFQKRYPEIRVVYVPGMGGPTAQRILAERRAGKYLVDLCIGGAGTIYALLYRGKVLDALKPALILPEVVDPSKWWSSGRYNFVDNEGQYIFAFNGELHANYGYHTKLVNPGVIRSYWDFLNPKWKGKMVAWDVSGGGGGGSTPLRFLYYHPQLGPEFLRRLLSEMDPTPSRDVRQIVDWLATGRYAISLFTAVNRTGLDLAKKQGLAVDWFGPKSLKEGIAVGSASGNVTLVNRAPHPHAARVALNWLLSREGQAAYQQVYTEADSLRIDIPKDHLPQDLRREEGGNYMLTERPELMEMGPIRKLVSEAWKRATKP